MTHPANTPKASEKHAAEHLADVEILPGDGSPDAMGVLPPYARLYAPRNRADGWRRVGLVVGIRQAVPKPMWRWERTL